jgi:hypothetical protein
MQTSIESQEKHKDSIYNQPPNPLLPLPIHHAEDQIIFMLDLVKYRRITSSPFILNECDKYLCCLNQSRMQPSFYSFFYFLSVNLTEQKVN